MNRVQQRGLLLITKLRLTRGWTRGVLAERAGVSVWSVGRAERGESISLTTAVKINTALDQPYERVWMPAVE